jgi:hypothetical protein
MTARTSRRASIALTAGLLLSLAAGFVMAVVLTDFAGTIFFVAFAGVGALLAQRLPTNSVGWLLMLMGWGLMIATVHITAPVEWLGTDRLSPFQNALAWANAWGWSPIFVGFLAITIVFPSGRLPGGRGRRPALLALGLAIGLSVLIAIAPTINVTSALTGEATDAPNPFAVAPDAPFWVLMPTPGIAYALLFAVVAAGVVALLARYRRAVGLERVQMRWLVAAIAAAAVANVIWAIFVTVLDTGSILPWVLVGVVYPCIPIAIAFAVFRYRLFDIDRIISRTIAYGAVVVVLGVVFGAGVVILSSALASVAQQAESIAVAASTLLTYAVLQPVVVRIRRIVDRRFDRTRYDAEQTVQAFAVRLRHETNVESVRDDLTATTRAVVAPMSTSLWLRPSGPAR